VIGAGHNGLTAAAVLAKRGRRVLVVERRPVVGGLCAGEEFHPGYHSAGLLHDTSGVRPGVVDALNLTQHGLEMVSVPPVFLADGPGLVLEHDPAAASAEIAKVSSRDAGRYREFHAFVGRIRRVVEPLLNDVPPDLINTGALGLSGMAKMAGRGLAIRRLGRRDMMDLMRVPPMCVADWLGEWFETDLLKAGLAANAIAGTWCGPWSPGTAANLIVWACTANRAVKGGPVALVAALQGAAGKLGVEIRTGAEVERIKIVKGAATGVVLAGGEEIHASAVASSCDPKRTFLDLTGPNDIAHAFARRIEAYRVRGTTAKVNLALNKPLSFASRPDAVFEFARTGADLDTQERAFDAVKYRRFSERPILDIYQPPGHAPAGHAAASILVHYAPYDLEGGWGDDQRERLGDAVVAELARLAPDVESTIVAREVITPKDIEARFGASGGHVHHGEHGLDQLLARPTIDAARYRTPITNLYICGSGSHPGGGVTCAPGALAAGVMD
jgi:phytoene dehydrogenase-like protein